MSVQALTHEQSTYDRVALTYDALYSRHVSAANARLTDALALRPGERVADIACGTGHSSVAIARAIAPGELVGVDFSEGMLAAARDRARAESLGNVTWVHGRAEEFISGCSPGTFDAVSLRFALAYLDWATVLPQIGKMLRPNGRAAILTHTTASVPQFYHLFLRYRDSLEPAWKLFSHLRRSLPATLRMYRRLRGTFGDGGFITVPKSAHEVAQALSKGGLVPTHAWTDTVRLWFSDGREVIQWMHQSGYVTHKSLEEAGPDAVRFLETLFSEGLETFREPEGIPLDLVMAGVVADR